MNEKILDISAIIGDFVREQEVLINGLLLKQYQQYGSLKPEDWLTKQYNALPILQKKILRNILVSKRKALQVVRKGLYLAYMCGKDERAFTRLIDQVSKKPVVTVPQGIRTEINNVSLFVAGSLDFIGRKKFDNYRKNVSVMFQKSIITTDPAKTLVDEILSRTTTIFDNKRILKPFDGNMATRKSIELGVRKSLQDITQQSFDESAFVFVIASEHGDSAPDHKEWQGKIYYNENWRKFVADPELAKQVESFISRRNLRSYQWVRGEPVQMWTRWNCRHKLRSVPIEDVLGKSLQTVLQENNFTRFGKPMKEKYDNLQLQRAYERNVRKYDERIKTMEMGGNPDLTAYNKAKMLKRKWQKKLTSLVKNNKVYLFRARDRENAKKLMFDFGIKLQLKEQE
jgi:hypothetical protein